MSSCLEYSSLRFMWVGRDSGFLRGLAVPYYTKYSIEQAWGLSKYAGGWLSACPSSPQKLSGQVDVPLSSPPMRSMSISPPPLLVSGNFVYMFCLLVVCVSGDLFVFS